MPPLVREEIMKRLSVALGLLSIVLASCNKGTATHESATEHPKVETASAAHEGPHWTYEGDTGPAAWGSLDPAWLPCGDGKSQSPIDIDKTVRADMPERAASYPPASLRITHAAHLADEINNGHTVQINYTDGDMLTIGAEQFELVQYHFHVPSEHTVKGQHHAMEMHLVHKSSTNKLAVIGVFIDEGAHNAAFDPILGSLPTATGGEAHLKDVTVDVNQLLPADLDNYRYDGSLTTPPCTEGVTWIVLTTPIQMSADQIAAFRAVMNGNNRPVQPLNGRVVATDRITTVQ
jgi:carbonic anhydrase